MKISDKHFEKVVTKDTGDSGVQIILGVEDEKTEPIAYHFDKAKWKISDVKKFIKDHDLKPLEVVAAKKSSEEPKENSSIVTHNGLPIEETKSINDYPGKTGSQVRQQDVPDIVDALVQSEGDTPIVGSVEEPLEVELEEVPEPIISDNLESDDPSKEDIDKRPSFDENIAKEKLLGWAKKEDGSINKKLLMKHFLDIDGGAAQTPDSYRFMVSTVRDGETEPSYCQLAMDRSWDLASGKQTGIANRNVQKKIIFLKNREGMDLTEDQMDFTQRHMSAPFKLNYRCKKQPDGSFKCPDQDTGQTQGEPVKKYENRLRSATVFKSSDGKMYVKTGDGQMFKAKDETRAHNIAASYTKSGVAPNDEGEWAGEGSNTNKNNYNENAAPGQSELFMDDEHSPGGLDLVNEDAIKLNESPAGSKIIYEDSSVIDVPVIPMREGVFTGTDGIPTLKKFEHFSKDAHWLEGQPILKGHTGPTELVTYRHNRIGKLLNVTARPDKKDVVAVARYYKEKLTPEDLTRIKSGTPYDGSIAYTTHTSMNSGDYNGSKYNAVEDGGYHFYHFAELANGIGACSTKDGCGFMLNEASEQDDVPENDNQGDIIIKTYFNEKRRAEVVESDGQFQVKLNSKSGGSGLLSAGSRDQALEWSKVYVRSSKIPASMKLNYNYVNDNKNSLDDLKMTTKLNKKGMVTDEAGNECMFFEMKDKKCPVEDGGSEEDMSEDEAEKKNSRFDNMTEEYIAPEADASEIVQKLNADFTMQLNERDQKISQLETALADLVQKQNAAEEAQVQAKAAEDFAKFTQKLNKAHEKDAQLHYDGFKANGWAYIDEHPEVFRIEKPKMNARGVPAGDGDNASGLAQARQVLRSTLKENSKRSH